MIALGLSMGWMMGGYQMLKGAHYLSHTVTTMIVAWIVAIGKGVGHRQRGRGVFC